MPNSEIAERSTRTLYMDRAYSCMIKYQPLLYALNPKPIHVLDRYLSIPHTLIRLPIHAPYMDHG